MKLVPLLDVFINSKPINFESDAVKTQYCIRNKHYIQWKPANRKNSLATHIFKPSRFVAGYSLYRPTVDDDSVDWGIAARGPHEYKLSGEITIVCPVFDKLRKIKTELKEHNYILAIKAYQERLPIVCMGDLFKENDIFILKSPGGFQIENI